jgi:cytosine/adenosine deaminase-related metal-dependent hydrolase
MKRFLLALLLSAASAAQAETLLINGTIVAADRVIPSGWLIIEDGKIRAITEARPDAKADKELVTKDIVFPGFVDLHNHPLYGIFPRWKPGKTYANRYQWRGDAGYLTSIQNPEGKLVTEHFCDMDAYVELQQLMGGTTSILGLYQPADTPKVEPCVEGLARNLDWASGFHGAGVGNERMANVLGVRPNDIKLSPQAMEKVKSGDYDLIAVHLAEGRRGDADSQAEFAQLKSLGLLSEKTAIIHGGGLREADFAEIAKARAAFVWSPRSNFELYGETADVPAAMRQKVVIALAPDWSPTGSMNMLAEVGYAKQVSDRDFGKAFSSKYLFEMATVIPARVAKIDDKVGSLKPGVFADVFLLRGDASDPYEALVKAKPQDVTLTMVNGKPIYGARDYLTKLGAPSEALTVCGEARAAALPIGAISGRLQKALADEKLKLGPLTECREAITKK